MGFFYSQPLEAISAQNRGKTVLGHGFQCPSRLLPSRHKRLTPCGGREGRSLNSVPKKIFVSRMHRLGLHSWGYKCHLRVNTVSASNRADKTMGSLSLNRFICLRRSSTHCEEKEIWFLSFFSLAVCDDLSVSRKPRPRIKFQSRASIVKGRSICSQYFDNQRLAGNR